MKLKRENIGITILAGGKSSRMGEDKSRKKVNGKNFLQHIITASEPISKAMTIVGKKNIHQKYGYPVYEDIYPNLGPLGGIYTALVKSEKEINLVLSCDVPFIKTELLQKLLDACKDEFDQVQFSANGKTMPLVALYKKECLGICLEQIEKGDLKMMRFVERLKHKTIEATDEEAMLLSNINTREELEKIKQQFA